MSTLIQDALNYSRIGKDDSQFTNVNLNRILEDLKNDYENLICEKRAIITSSDLTEIHGNESQIRQLFANLLSNALKFCVADCRISITSDYPGLQERSVHDFLDPDKSYIRLVFSDNGIGFDNKYAEKIFMIFQRLHHNSNYAGTGIGLSLCKKIVENHHGYIVADSPTGTGATFTVWLPTTQ